MANRKARPGRGYGTGERRAVTFHSRGQRGVAGEHGWEISPVTPDRKNYRVLGTDAKVPAALRGSTSFLLVRALVAAMFQHMPGNTI